MTSQSNPPPSDAAPLSPITPALEESDRLLDPQQASSSKASAPPSMSLLQTHVATYLGKKDEKDRLKVLLAMSYGMGMDFEKRFESIVKNGGSIGKADVCITGDLWKAEVVRHGELIRLGFMVSSGSASRMPQPKNWNNDKSKEWLEKNPLVDVEERNYIIRILDTIIRQFEDEVVEVPGLNI